MSKHNRKRKVIGRKEFIFNVVSLIVAICVGLYFGGRSLYYYSKQSSKLKEEAMTLNGEVINNNKVTTDKDGIHQDTNGYYFRGNVSNNYVLFSNRLFRIVRINNDNSIRLVSNDIVGEFMWGEDSSYFNSNLYSWLTTTNVLNSGVYYRGLTNPDNFLIKTKYSEDVLENSKVKSSNNINSDYVTTLSVKDFNNAGGKNSYLNIGKFFWLLGLDSNESNLYVLKDGSVDTALGYEGYGVRAVITLKKNIEISGGNGTLSDPYVIKEGNDINYVDKYVKLDNDTYKVFQDSDGYLKLSLNGYILNNGSDYLVSYSNKNSIYDITNLNNIGYYLNNTYYNSLSYSDLLSDCTFFTGEVSSETGFKYEGIFNSSVTAKVGLLNLFDYNSNSELNDYFFGNMTSSIGSMEYVYNNLGLLSEDKVTEKKHVVPVVCIDRNLIKSGSGSLYDPFVAR